VAGTAFPDLDQGTIASAAKPPDSTTASVSPALVGSAPSRKGVPGRVRNAPQMASRNGMNFEDRTYALSIVMNQDFFKELSTWLTEAGLASAPETSIVSGFCDRCVAAGLPLARSLMFIDTLHPIHEGRLFRWGYDTTETPLREYGRTSPDALAASGFKPRDVETAEAGDAVPTT
jgi:hypothetical protein